MRIGLIFITFTQAHNTICHILDGVIMRHHDDGVSVFSIDGFNEFENFFGCMVM